MRSQKKQSEENGEKFGLWHEQIIQPTVVDYKVSNLLVEQNLDFYDTFNLLKMTVNGIILIEEK